jgi:drug/metabolite transporter (DMT)-like permease
MLIFKTPVVWPNSISWVLLMIGVSLCGFCVQLFVTMGLQRETASRGIIGTYTQIIFAEISDRILFHSKLSVLALFGTGIILTSAVYVAVSGFHFTSIIEYDLMTWRS